MPQPFTAASHHDVLMLLIQLAVLLFTARLMGELAQRLRQPAVVGEILAGIVLGPSLLSGLVPALGAWIVPQTEVQGYLLEVVSLIGAMFLLLITGLETDIALIRRHARTAIGVSFGGILTTFASGFLLGQFLPDSLLAQGSTRLVFSLFVATAMSISAIPVIAKVLMDMNLMRRDIGQTIIAAGMSDDTIGWILLSIVAGLAGGAAVTLGSVLQAVGSVLAFMILSFTLGRWLVEKLLGVVQDEFRSPSRILTFVVGMTFLWGAITQALNLEAVLGAFVMGILFSQMRKLPAEVVHTLEKVALGIFAPVFFAVAGLKVNLASLLDPSLLLMALLVIAVATGGKVLGTYLGARLIGRRDHWTALSFGAGLNARGAMEIIIATIGLRLGILSQDMFSIIVVMAMATSLMAPSALRWVLKRVTPSQEELDRLRREELNQSSLIPNIHRVLLPLRARAGEGPSQAIEACLLNKLDTASPVALTLLTVDEERNRPRAVEHFERTGRLFAVESITRKFVASGQIANAILDEVSKDYDLLVLGAPESQRDTEALFNPLLDQLIRHSPVPTLLVHGQAEQLAEGGWTPRRVLVPCNGSLSSRRAVELAFALCAEQGEEVLLLWVIETQQSEYLAEIDAAILARQRAVAERSLEGLQGLAGPSSGAVTAHILSSSAPDQAILSFAETHQVDLVVLGTNIGISSEQLYLGPRVESILYNARCPVIVINP